MSLGALLRPPPALLDSQPAQAQHPINRNSLLVLVRLPLPAFNSLAFSPLAANNVD